MDVRAIFHILSIFLCFFYFKKERKKLSNNDILFFQLRRFLIVNVSQDRVKPLIPRCIIWKIPEVILLFFYSTMRQLKGKVKETNKQKKERKKEFLENKRRVFTVVLPTLGAVFLLIVLYVYIKTRPKSSLEY